MTVFFRVRKSVSSFFSFVLLLLESRFLPLRILLASSVSSYGVSDGILPRTLRLWECLVGIFSFPPLPSESLV